MTIEKDHVDTSRGSSTRRDLLKLAGAAAVGAAGATALRAIPVGAAGSGYAIGIFPPLPIRVLDTRKGFGPLAGGGGEYPFGPFPAAGGFDSTSYYGMMGNLTATGWNQPGWLSIQGFGSTVAATSNVNFSGPLVAIANFVMTQFGGSVIIGQPSNGTVTIRVGGPSTLRVHVVLDLFAYLGPDQ